MKTKLNIRAWVGDNSGNSILFRCVLGVSEAVGFLFVAEESLQRAARWFEEVGDGLSICQAE